MPRKKPGPPSPPQHRAIILKFEPQRYAGAVWRRDEDGEPIYDLVHDNVREAKIAATLARTSEGDATQP